MNHDDTPKSGFKRWWHFRMWQYGTCHDKRARKHRGSGAVQFVLWNKGHVVKCGSDYEKTYTYLEDWWHDFHSFWWSEFVADPK